MRHYLILMWTHTEKALGCLTASSQVGRFVHKEISLQSSVSLFLPYFNLRMQESEMSWLLPCPMAFCGTKVLQDILDFLTFLFCF